MKVFLCRWPNGDLSIVGAHDREGAIYILDEFADATYADMFETKSLLINFQLDINGHLILHEELQQFGEGLYNVILEKAYPLLLQGRTNSCDNSTHFPEAAKAERQRLSPTKEVRPTEPLAKNLLIARIASDQNINLPTALKKIKSENLSISESWHTLATQCARLNEVRSNKRHSSIPDPSSGALRMSAVSNKELNPYDRNDLLPHYLLAAIIADQANRSILVAWPHVRPYIEKPIGTFWRWLAQEVRNLPQTPK